MCYIYCQHLSMQYRGHGGSVLESQGKSLSLCLLSVSSDRSGETRRRCSVNQYHSFKRGSATLCQSDWMIIAMRASHMEREGEKMRGRVCVFRWQDEMQSMRGNCRGNWYWLCPSNSTQRLYIATVKKDCLSDTNYIYIYIYIYIYTHSPATLLGRYVQLLGNTNC